MANQTVTKVPDYIWWGGEWTSANVASRQVSLPIWGAAEYREEFERPLQIASCSFKETFIPASSYTGTIVVACDAVGKIGNTTVWSYTQTFNYDISKQTDHTFSFSGLSGNVDSIEFTIYYDDEYILQETFTYATAPNLTYTYTPPTLGLSVTPSSLYVGETMSCYISEPFGQTFNVFFSYNSTTLQNFSTSSNSFTQTANESWFSTAGVTGNSMQVTVSISDGLGRTASARVTVNKHTALVPTISAPKGGSFDGGQSITFAWTSAGDGSQTKAELQWSKDNVNWSALTTVSGSGTQWTAPAGKFSAGTIYWRLRLTNNHGLTSGWVSQSFAVVYTGASVTLTAPTSGTLDGGQEITFAWEITKGTGTIDGTQMQISSDDGIRWTNLVNASTAVTSYKASPGYLPRGRVLWRVRARDSYSGWGEWKQAAITVAYTGASVTLISPTSGTLDGGQQNTFAWSIDTGSGTAVTGVQMQISNDDGISWNTVLDSTGMSTSYVSAAGELPSSRLIWRVRARGTYGDYSAWKQATVTVNYTPATVTLTSPTSGTKDGGQAIKFVWEVTKGSGSVTGTQMAYSTDSGVNWTILVNSTSSVTSYTAAAGKLPGGAFRWRVRARDTYAGWGDWKTANITISYTAPVVTLTAPTSGTKDGGQAIAFAWTIAKGSGRVNGTQMNYSTDGGITWSELVAIAAEVTSYTAPAGKFKAGSMIWRARAQDQYAGMGEYKQATITISYTPATVTLTTPTSGSWDGAEAITFGWSITKGSGSVTGIQMQISTDDGLTWSDLINSNSQVTTYTSAVAQFPAGALKWRVRAKDSYSGYVDNWKTATIIVTYSAVSQVVAVNSPTSGVYNAAAARTFSVRLDASGPVHTPFQIQEASFFWRSGETGDFTELSMTPGGNTAAVEIPAGTFPSGRIEWYASATDTTERTTETPHYVLTALQTAVEAAPLSPISTIESGSGPITFRWTYGSLDGAPQGRAQLQYSRDGETWTDEHTFADITGSQTNYTAPAGTFPGGAIFWRVRSYNDAGTAGPWSAAVSFSSYSAPLVTGVIGDGRPFATITWQADGQEAYEIEVGDKTYGPYYGADVRSFTLPEPLPDGSYTIRVRAQNKMTLWSQWIEGQMSVVNVPSNGIVLSGAFSDVADLSWELAPALNITKQPESVVSSDYVGFSVGVEGANLSYRWQIERLIGNNIVYSNFDGVTGGTSQAIAVKPAESVSTLTLRCLITNPDGTAISETATWTRGTAAEPPKVLYAACVPDTDQEHFYIWLVATGWTELTIYRRRAGSEEWTVYTTFKGAVKARLFWNYWKGYEFYAAFSNEAGMAETEIFSIPETPFPVPVPDTQIVTIPDTTPSFVYRDGKRIGVSSNGRFTDRLELGTHAYKIIKDLANGYYNISNIVTGTASVSCPAIAPLEGGDFLSLKLSENSDREIRITEAREVEWTQYAGADYPSAEIGEGKSKAVALDVSALMSDEDFAKAFTALLGQDVIVKTPDGTVVIGPLEALDLRAPRSHRSWTFDVTQMEWEDFVDES